MAVVLCGGRGVLYPLAEVATSAEESYEIKEDMPLRFQTVEDWFPRFLLCVPAKLKDAVIQEQTYGSSLRVMDVLFKLMTLMQPKGVEEQDALLKQLTSPCPCRDPAAASRELKR